MNAERILSVTQLKDVLYTLKKYRIPRYQRPYAWSLDQVSEFWNDLITSDEPNFLGSLIFNTEPVEEDGVIDIIDGQQRHSTLARGRTLRQRLIPRPFHHHGITEHLVFHQHHKLTQPI